MGQIRWFRTRTPPGSGPTRTLSGVGFALRETRVTAGLELTELARRTGVETRYLRALEWERDDLIPDPGARAAALEAYMREVG
ncbi:MAG: helix-turn-helix domain-containing protein, partial [Gaiellales bacterium]